MLKIIYGPGGIVSSDFNLESWRKEFKNYIDDDQCHSILVSNEMLIDLVRAMIARGEVDYTNVSFEYEGNEIKVNRYGAMDSPRGFCDLHVSLAEEILKSAMSTRKKERKIT